MTTTLRTYIELMVDRCGECNVAVWQTMAPFPQAPPPRKNRSKPSVPTNAPAASSGDEEFQRKLEKQLDRVLRRRKPGPKGKKGEGVIVYGVPRIVRSVHLLGCEP